MSSVMSHAPIGGDLMRTSVETLAEAYQWLGEVRVAHASFVLARADRLKKLDARARYVLGSLDAARRFLEPSTAAEAAVADTDHAEAVRAEREALGDADHADAVRADGQAGTELLPAAQELDDPLAEMVARSRAELEATRADLDAWAEAEAARFEEAFEAAETAIVGRVTAYLAHHQPHVRVEVSQLAGDRCIIHLNRPSDDDAVLLCHLLAGRPPTRHDYLRDDAVDDVGGPIHLAVREPDLDPEAVTAGGAELEDALVRDEGGRRLLPIRAHLPILLPKVDWPRLRLRCRGPVLELEARGAGEPYGHIVPAEQAELLTGYLVSLRARGRLDVDVDVT